MCSICIAKFLHFTVFYLDYIQNPTIVQFDTLCVSLFHLPVFWYLCIPPSCVVVFRLNFVLRGVGALDDRGETDVRTARDPGIPIKFTPSTPHCSGNTPKYKYTQIRPTTQRSRALAVFEGWLSAAHCWGLSCLLLSESRLWEYLSWYKPNDRDGDDDDGDDDGNYHDDNDNHGDDDLRLGAILT